MKLIAVSGARRNVGKTYIALRMCDILGDAVYAKIGHGEKVASKPENFFTSVDDFLLFVDGLGKKYQYCIVESNNHAICKLADMRIFIDAPQSETDIRDDAEELKQGADVVITPANKISNEIILSRVSEIIPAEKMPMFEKLFRSQQRYLNKKSS